MIITTQIPVTRSQTRLINAPNDAPTLVGRSPKSQPIRSRRATENPPEIHAASIRQRRPTDFFQSMAAKPQPKKTTLRKNISKVLEQWCICRKEDDGRKMIECDSRKCAVQWFHLQCMGIKKVPKGKWYCPNCQLLKR